MTGNTGATTCTIPAQLQPACEAFKNFYLASHSGRRLYWLTSMGSADLRATFADGVKRELSVKAGSTFEATVQAADEDISREATVKMAKLIDGAVRRAGSDYAPPA